MKKISALLLILTCFFYNGCGDIELNSNWKTRNITIDGDDSDWNDLLTPSEKVNASIGVMNDKSYLYICLSTTDPGLETKILNGGLTLWFQGNENSADKFGIHYPVGISDTSMPPFDENMRPGEKLPDPSQMLGNQLKRQTNLEIITGKMLKIPVSELKDITLKMAIKNGKLVYEMKIPLNQKDGASYTLNTVAGGTIKTNFVTGAIEPGIRPGFMPPEGGFDMPPGGDEGPGGGPGGAPGGGGFPPAGMGRDMFSSEPVNLLINIKLASE
jgi:hypothetical protein